MAIKKSTRFRLDSKFIQKFRILLSAFAVACILFLSANSASAQFLSNTELSGDIAVTFREFEKHTEINTNFRGDSPFNTIRVRTFVNSSFDDDVDMSLEFLWDDDADPRVNGAWLTFYKLINPLILKVGLVASPFGNFGYKSTYFNRNPLISVPAMWQYKTPLPSDGLTSNDSLLQSRKSVNHGVNIAYDACWDTGLEFILPVSEFEFVYAITNAVLSNPRASSNDGYQHIGTIRYKPALGLHLGISAAYGPWIAPKEGVIYLKNVDSYMQSAVGGYVEYERGFLRLSGEFAHTEWYIPHAKDSQAGIWGLHEDRIDAWSGYVEGRYDLFAWLYVGARYDVFRYGEISTGNDGSGSKEKWGYDFDRLEWAVGYRVHRSGVIRLGYQLNSFLPSGVDPLELLALQFSFEF